MQADYQIRIGQNTNGHAVDAFLIEYQGDSKTDVVNYLALCRAEAIELGIEVLAYKRGHVLVTRDKDQTYLRTFIITIKE